MMDNYLLSMLAFSPLLGIIALLFVPKTKAGTIKTIGIITTLIPLLLAVLLFASFNFDSGEYQFTQEVPWIQFQIPLYEQQLMQINYELGVDGLAVSLILLTAIIGTLAAIASIYIKKRWKEYFILFFILLTGMLGVFMSLNLFMFFIFFELTIIPMYFLIGIWGYEKRENAANHFLIYNGVGSAVMLIAFVALLMQTGTTNIPALTTIMAHPVFAEGTFKLGVFLALLFAFGVKLPIFPLHSWMLKVHVQAPPAIVMIHSGILLKLGAYGLIRLGMGVFPDQIYYFSLFLAILGVINVLYGAILAFVQTDLKMVLAYSSVSHMGIILMGIAALNISGLKGAVFQAISHGLISALLFFIIGVIYERTQTSEISELGGLAKSMPFVSGIFLAGAMANLGLPGMSGFISEFLAFLGLFQIYPWVTVVGALGLIFTAAYLLKAILNTTFGPTKEEIAGLTDARGFEVVPMVVLLGLIILIGVFPSILGQTIEVSVQNLVQSLWARIGG